MLYDIKYTCRYFNDNIFLETDNITEEEQDYVRNILYKEDFVNILGVDLDCEFDVFNTTISNLYEKINKCDFFKECMKKLAATLLSTEEELGLCILYSYDFMHLTHKCVSEYLDNGLISDENMNLLIESVNNYVNN